MPIVILRDADAFRRERADQHLPADDMLQRFGDTPPAREMDMLLTACLMRVPAGTFASLRSRSTKS